MGAVEIVHSAVFAVAAADRVFAGAVVHCCGIVDQDHLVVDLDADAEE